MKEEIAKKINKKMFAILGSPLKFSPVVLMFMIGLALYALFPTLIFAQDASVKVVLDPTFGMPAPPNENYPYNAEHVFVSSIIMLSIGVLVTLIAAWDSIRMKNSVPVCLVISAAFCVVPESFDNVMAGVYWVRDGKNILYFLLGREFDYYVITMWYAFGAVLGYIIFVALRMGVKTKVLWIALGLSGLADIIIEEILLNYGGVYMYFGHQPLVLITKFPWWWLFANVGALFLGAAIAYRFRDWFNGWKACLLWIIVPVCYIGMWSFAAMPAAFAIQGNFSWLTTQLLGIVTCILALVGALATMRLVLLRNPFDMEGVPMEEAQEMVRVRSDATRA